MPKAKPKPYDVLVVAYRTPTRRDAVRQADVFYCVVLCDMSQFEAQDHLEAAEQRAAEAGFDNDEMVAFDETAPAFRHFADLLTEAPAVTISLAE